MIKKLDKLILGAFIGPFLATFLLAIFVLILQFFWLWIDDFVGKGIDFGTLATLVMYVAASWVPVALPLAILLSTIMTFGNLGESYELVAIKSAGISLQRFMRPILVVSVVISGIAFLFNNNIIPVINLKLNKLKYEIVYTKPAFDIKPGVFYDKIDGYAIKLGKKDKDGGKIEDIIIYEKAGYQQDNLILAEGGSMKVSNDKRFLEFNLLNGVRYEEKNMRNIKSAELTRIKFKEYKKVFDLSSFKMVQGSDSGYKDNYRMLSVGQLSRFIDSSQKKVNEVEKRIYSQNALVFQFDKWHDSGKIKLNTPLAKVPKNMSEIVPDSLKDNCYNMALASIGTAKSTLDVTLGEYNDAAKQLHNYQFGWQSKFSLSVACFILFLIGAPLGSIIRKGGIGMPLVLAVIFFVIFHLLNTMGEKMVRTGVLPSFFGTWLPNIVLLPVGLFLTYKAMRDSQLFNKDVYLKLFKGIKSLLSVFKKKKVALVDNGWPKS